MYVNLAWIFSWCEIKLAVYLSICHSCHPFRGNKAEDLRLWKSHCNHVFTARFLDPWLHRLYFLFCVHIMNRQNNMAVKSFMMSCLETGSYVLPLMCTSVLKCSHSLFSILKDCTRIAVMLEGFKFLTTSETTFVSNMQY